MEQTTRPLLALLLILLLARVTLAQAPVRNQVEALPIGGKLTVILPDGHEYYGHMRSIEPESFSIREVDLKQVLTFRYDEVKKVRKDYGRRGFLGKRVNPRTNRITFLIAVGALFGLVIGAVLADKS